MIAVSLSVCLTNLTISLSVCLTNLTNISFDSIINCLFRVTNKETIPGVVLLLVDIALNSSVAKLSSHSDMHGVAICFLGPEIFAICFLGPDNISPDL